MKAIELNEDLLHLLNADNSLLVGNGGWSYTLNNTTPSGSDEVSITTVAPTVLKDSIAFDGRTPCQIPGIISPGNLCYKLKWHIVLYANAQMNKPGTFKVLEPRGAELTAEQETGNHCRKKRTDYLPVK